MRVFEFVLAFAGLACAVTGEVMVARDFMPQHRGHLKLMLSDGAFWGLAGLALCQVLWIARLA